MLIGNIEVMPAGIDKHGEQLWKVSPTEPLYDTLTDAQKNARKTRAEWADEFSTKVDPDESTYHLKLLRIREKALKRAVGMELDDMDEIYRPPQNEA